MKTSNLYISGNLSKNYPRIFLSLLFLVAFTNCIDQEVKYEKIEKEKSIKKKAIAALSKVSALPIKVKSPQDNPTSNSKVLLGRLLFFDPILSGNKDVACASCHHPDNGYAEFRDISIGVNGKGFGSKRAFVQPNDIPFVKRNAHTILNTAFNGIDLNNIYTPAEAPMFWDSRVRSLENQALEPIKALEEMRGRGYAEEKILDEVIGRLKAIPEYQRLFEEAFHKEDAIDKMNLGKAIAAFERSLVTNNSRFDQFMRGKEDAISITEKEGFDLFKKVGCISCHNGPMFSDYKMHVLGVPENEKLPQPDSGFEEGFAFRTASLRNLRFTAPYMHNGSFNSLQRVLEFYEDIASGKVRNPSVTARQFDPLVKELSLKVKDMTLLISFLNTLNDTNFDKEIPESVPSGLSVGGNIH